MTVSKTPGAPCWVDLLTTDTAAAARFYAAVLGWTAGEASSEFGGYFMMFRDGEPVAGVMPANAPDDPSSWTVYLETPDLAATVARAQQAGGMVVMGPIDIDTMGAMAVVIDPTGAAVGAWQPHEFEGFAVRAQDGAPAWFEVLSPDYPTSVAFYRDVFGWQPHTMSDTPEFRYTTLGEGYDAMAGVMDVAGQPDAQTRWHFYVQVPDVDAACERAAAAGGGVTTPAVDTPYGRVAVLRDPTGAQLSVMKPPVR